MGPKLERKMIILNSTHRMKELVQRKEKTPGKFCKRGLNTAKQLQIESNAIIEVTENRKKYLAVRKLSRKLLKRSKSVEKALRRRNKSVYFKFFHITVAHIHHQRCKTTIKQLGEERKQLLALSWVY